MANETMTREKMRAIQAQPRNPVLRVHSCCGGVAVDKTIIPTATLRRTNPGQSPAEYACTACGAKA